MCRRDNSEKDQITYERIKGGIVLVRRGSSLVAVIGEPSVFSPENREGIEIAFIKDTVHTGSMLKARKMIEEELS